MAKLKSQFVTKQKLAEESVSLPKSMGEISLVTENRLPISAFHRTKWDCLF
jgi:hypothetical protein